MLRFKLFLGVLGMPAVFAAVYFGAAGRLNLLLAWGVVAALTLFLSLLIGTMPLALLRERVAPGPGN